MLGLNLKSDVDRIIAEVGAFSREEQGKAISRALNEAARGAVTDASKKIRESFKMKKADVDTAFTVIPASPTNLVAKVVIRGRPLSVGRFATSQITTRGKGGVWVNIKGQRKFFPHAWMQTLKSSSGADYQVLMGRVGASRMPVQVFHTVDIPSVFETDNVYGYVSAQSVVRVENGLERALRFFGGS